MIKHLTRLPADTQVLVEGYENGYDDIVELRELDVFRYKTAQEWDGEYQTIKALPGFRDKETFPAAVIQGRRGNLR
ncbi:hypothetical protein [Marinobacter sp. LV10R510-11A]|uniref:hypothetical protein n=1 Tax=Marinobacter sp. LV10R510-11A TaxID=1415568 RepID=UPI001D0D3CF3|nr:hypothetical protein [Marinobacter sp. LV10R510-11A]